MQTSLVNTDKKNNTKFASIQDILKDPAKKARLNNLVDEAVRCKQAIYTQQQTIKDLRDVARNDLMLNPKLFSYYVGAVFNNDYSARKDNLDQLSMLIDAVIGLLPPDHSAYTGEND